MILIKNRAPIEEEKEIQIFKVTLGEIGREGNAHTEGVNKSIMYLIPILETWLESGKLKPMEYELVEGVGVDKVLKALEIFEARKRGDKKVVVRLADD